MVDTAALADRLDIADVLARYAIALDTKDWDLLSTVFTDDAAGDYGATGQPRGLEEIKQMINSTIGDLDATQHLIGNVIVTVSGDEATASCYLISQHIRRDTPGGDSYLLGGTYADELVRTRDGWRIRSRTLHRQWATGNRAVVARS